MQEKKIILTEKQIEDIADELDSGLQVFYHYQTQELKSFFPDEWTIDFIEEETEKRKKIEENINDYYAFDTMASWESF